MSLICISSAASFCVLVRPNSLAVFTAFTVSFEELARPITSAFEARACSIREEKSMP